MLIPQSATTIGSVNTFRNDYCVYQHVYGDPEAIIYIGVCPLRDMLLGPDAAQNSEWLKMVNPNHSLTVTLLAIGPSAECYNHRVRMLHSMTVKPICNQRGVLLSLAAQPFRCDQTGQVFQSQVECARIMGLSQPALSNHLAGKIGWKRVKGYTFSRIVE